MDKAPWEVFRDVCWELLSKDGHEIAVARAFAACLYDRERQNMGQVTDLSARLKVATDRWEADDQRNSNELSRIFRDEWTDWGLQ